jgi:mono/diheme cytochrome c family protein
MRTQVFMTKLSIQLRDLLGCRSRWLLAGLLWCLPCLIAQQDVPEAQKNPFAVNTDANNAGRKIYDGACQGCHGGGEARGSDRAPALGGGFLTHGNADGEIFQNIRAGIRGTAIPPFGQFSTDQIWQVVSCVGCTSPIMTVEGGTLPGRVLATAGGLVFAASRESNFLALDARSSKALWHFGAGAEIASSPMSYAVDGRQYIAVSSGGALFSFALPPEAGNTVRPK